MSWQRMIVASRSVWRPPLQVFTALMPLGLTFVLFEAATPFFNYVLPPAAIIVGFVTHQRLSRDLIAVPVYTVAVGAFLLSARVCWAFASGDRKVAEPRLRWTLVLL